MSKKAIIFTIDGVRADAIQLANTPYLDSKLLTGASSFNGRCIMPSITTPNHASLFRSQSAEQHGIFDNYDLAAQDNTHLSLFDKIYDSGKLCAAVISYLPLMNAYGHCEKLNFALHSNISIGVEHKIPDNYYALLEQHLVKGAKLIIDNNVDLAHVYIEAPDVVGHNKGWMSDHYIESIEQSDRLIASFIEQLGESAKDYTFFVTTDHGGHGHDHGTDCAEDMTIWFISFGDSIKQTKIDNFSILDVVPSIAQYLGVEPETHWQGKPLDIYSCER
ncbi:MAG: alkaline phosphatase family protein [Oceanospirillaceae bacterium]